ncbi:MAG: AEC family transporter [Clostridia bacterium]|nr:AEC family transporter [Clostridia bacterium]
MEVFLLTLKTVALLLLYIAIGFFLGKKKIIGENASKTLAALLTYVIMPLYSVVNLSKTVTVEKISLYLEIFAAGIAIAAISIALCIPLSKLFCKRGYSRNIYKYLIFTPNLGYFGYPLVQAVWGNAALSMYMIFTLPINIGINTYGYMILTDKGEENVSISGIEADKAHRKDVLKRIFSAPMVGTFVGIIIGLLPIELPETVYDFLNPAADCMRAVAMLLTGLVLSELTLKTLFTSKKAYYIGVLRLIVYPVIFGGVAYLLYMLGLSQEIFKFTVCLMALPAGMNVVVFPEAIGMSGKEGAQACFVSYLMVIITLPLILLATTSLFSIGL